MYYCNECEEFIVPSEEGVCPRCGTDDIEKATECKSCKGEIRSSEDYCKDCLRIAESHICKVAENLKTDRETAKDLILAVMEKENKDGTDKKIKSIHR
ncbi:MAG: hypothetical protein ACK5MV_13750 [Aminipila sp.]